MQFSSEGLSTDKLRVKVEFPNVKVIDKEFLQKGEGKSADKLQSRRSIIV